LIYELLAGGDVYQRLKKVSQQNLSFTWRERTSAIFDASCGLSHLHHASPKVFHRDIKTANILLDRNGTAKMADFGLACLSHAMAHRVEKTSGTTGYACPLYAKRSVVTEGSEVYSFGMVMLEVLTNQAPAILMQSPDGGQFYRFLICEIQGSPEIAAAMADAKASWPAEIAAILAQLGLRCTHEQEEHRPGFAEIVNSLRPLRDYAPPTVNQGPSFTISDQPYLIAKPPKAASSPIHLQDVSPSIQRRATFPHMAQGVPQGHAQAVFQQPMPQAVQPQVVHQAFAQQGVQQQILQHAVVTPKKLPLWLLKCEFVESDTFKDFQEPPTITHWQDVGAPLATTQHVGRLFQEDLFQKVTNPSTMALVSREHFQIWVEELDMPGVLEASSTCRPCSFFLTNFSTNGTLVNGEQLGKYGQASLHTGDTICIPMVITGSDGPQVVPFIQFRFDLTGSILRDATILSNGQVFLS
jgi:serine/threonine protein kinase